SDAVIEAVPAVLKVRLKVFDPLTSEALPGSVALVSVQVMAMVSLVLTTFQLASTPLTVTVNAAPAVCVAGAPSLPLAVPGAEVSPGTSNCTLARVAAAIAIAGLVLAALVGSDESLAVTVAEPAVFNVIFTVLVPLSNVPSA